ncbi:MAG: hypothetical protein ABGZ36_06725 [Actinomycetota bacterium]
MSEHQPSHPLDPSRADAALGVLVGVAPDIAVVAARRVDADWPGVGLLVAGALAAARWGVDLVPAIQRLADDEPLRGTTSDYEVRFAVEEASDDLDRALDRLAAGMWDGEDGEAILLPPRDAEIAAATIAIEGRRAWQLDSGTPPRSSARVAALAARLGARLVTDGHDPVAQATGPLDGDETTVLVGWDRLLRT